MEDFRTHELSGVSPELSKEWPSATEGMPPLPAVRSPLMAARATLALSSLLNCFRCVCVVSIIFTVAPFSFFSTANSILGGGPVFGVHHIGYQGQGKLDDKLKNLDVEMSKIKSKLSALRMAMPQKEKLKEVFENIDKDISALPHDPDTVASIALEKSGLGNSSQAVNNDLNIRNPRVKKAIGP
ncbi:MAG: hypothetical protein AAB091_06685 [Elusimicrobiota bacterium]